MMGKPDFSVYESFRKRFFDLTKGMGKEQYLVPYLMSSHPGSTLNEAVELALYLKRGGYSPEQVQDFYPTPGTASTVMYYTGIDPTTGKKVYTATDYHEKQMQRALLQWSRPENAPLVREALKACGREELIGFGGECLVRPDPKDIPFPLGANRDKKLKPAFSRNGNAEKGRGKRTEADNRGINTANRSGSAKKPFREDTTKRGGMQLKNGKPIRKEGWAKPKPKKKK